MRFMFTSLPGIAPNDVALWSSPECSRTMPVILAHVAAHRGVAKDRKEAVEQRSVEDALAAGKVFDELDTDGTATITAPQLRELLQRVTGSDVRDDGSRRPLRVAHEHESDDGQIGEPRVVGF